MEMTTKTVAWLVLGIVVTVTSTGCTTGPMETPASRSSPPQTQGSPPQTPRGTIAQCPVTVPSPATIPDVSADQLFGSDNSYTNGKLWVGGLGDAGVIRADPSYVARDGSIGWKFGWWRKAPGKLEISGRRLDAPAPPLRADVPTGYGRGGFQASGVTFPLAGCWKVTGRVGTTSLTFVTSVVKTSRRKPITRRHGEEPAPGVHDEQLGTSAVHLTTAWP